MQASMHQNEMRTAVIEKFHADDDGPYFETLDVHGRDGNRMILYLNSTAGVQKLQNALATSAYAPQAVQLAAWEQALRRFKEERGWA